MGREVHLVQGFEGLGSFELEVLGVAHEGGAHQSLAPGGSAVEIAIL